MKIPKALLQRLPFLLIGLSLFANSPAQAAKVIKVAGKQVLIRMDGEELNQGKYYYLLNHKSKKKGIVRILKIQDNKALAKLLKGRAEKNWTLIQRIKKRASKRIEETDVSSSYSKKPSWGILSGINMSSMKATVGTSLRSQQTDMTGMGYSLKGLIDHHVYSTTFFSLWFRGTSGYEVFNVSSSDTICAATGDQPCGVNISYLTFDLWGRLLLSQGTWRPWLGFGVDLMFPLQKESVTAIQSNSVTTTSIIAGGGGLDIFIQPTLGIPIQIEYGFFPPSKNVSTHWIAIRTGLTFQF